VASPGRALPAWLGVGAYAAATFLAFPHPVAGRVLDLGLGFAWLSPLALFAALEGLPPRAAARRGFLAGLAAHAAILHWIYVVTVHYGHAPAVVGVLAPVALAAYVAAFTAAFGAAYAWLAARGAAGPLVVAALWTALDWLRSVALTGFPWATLGYAQHANPALLGLAPWTGVYGLSFATALGAAGAWSLWCERRRGAPPGRAGLAALAGVALLAAAGLASSAALPQAEGPGVRIAVVQGNIDQGVKWSPEWVGETLRIYQGLTREAAAAGAEVVVWPESAVPLALELEGAVRSLLAGLAREADVALVVGAAGVEPGLSGGSPRVFDSAFVFAPDGRVTERYDKTHLVPFGEFIPLQDLLGRLLSAVARGIASMGVTPGEAPRALAIPLPGPGTRSLSAGVPICYELLFPDLVRRFARGGAELLLAITNDAWYGRTGAPYQFLAITALRAAETGLWTARAANTGVSAIIDGRGRVREQTPIFERAWLVAEVPRREAAQGETFYVRHGDWLPALCAALVLGHAIRGARRSHG